MSTFSRIYRKLTRKKSMPCRTGRPNREPWRSAGKRVAIHPTAIISPTASVAFWNKETPYGHIGLEIGEDSHIFSSFNLLRPGARIAVGKRCQLGNVLFACAKEIVVGDDVIMAWGINVLDSNHHAVSWENRKDDVALCRADALSGRPLGVSISWEHVAMENVVIGDKCWIGAGCFILKGVTIGEGAVVGAGSVVAKTIPPWDIVAGNPAKSIKNRGEENVIPR